MKNLLKYLKWFSNMYKNKLDESITDEKLVWVVKKLNNIIILICSFLYNLFIIYSISVFFDINEPLIVNVVSDLLYVSVFYLIIYINYRLLNIVIQKLNI